MKSLAAITAIFMALVGQGQANMRVMALVKESWARLQAQGFVKDALDHVSVLGKPQECINNKVTLDGEDFPCENVNFYSFLAMRDLEMEEPAHHATNGPSSSDIWGWLSPSGREFTLIALDNGVVAIDGTDPANPCIIAKMPTRRTVDKWGDVKVYENTLYHVKDTGISDLLMNKTNYGVEVYDLLQLDQLDCTVKGWVPLNLFPNFVYTGHGRSHNLAINPESGLLYSVGSEKCDAGLVILDVKTDRLKPTFLGCAEADGYTHDVQCLTYDGPDKKYKGKEICFAFNEDTLTVWDTSIPASPVIVSKTYYQNQVYSHQGWVNNDLTKILLDDELDELCNEKENAHSRCDDFATTNLTGLLKTSTVVIDITSLDKPFFEGAYVHPDLAIDHNLYVWGTIHRKGWGGNPAMEYHPDPNYAYMNNYLAGVKIVDIHSSDYTKWTQAGYFDIAPNLDAIEFAGAWSGYMHPSGVYAVSSIERGMFFLQPTMAFTADFPQDGSGGGGDDDGDDEGEDGQSSDDKTSAGSAILITLGVIFVIGALVAVVALEMKRRTNKAETAVSQHIAESQAKPNLSVKGSQIRTQNAMFDEDKVLIEEANGRDEVISKHEL